MIKACLFDIGNVLVSFDFRRTFENLAPRTRRSFEEIHRHIEEVSTELETGRMTSDGFVSQALEFIGGDLSREEFLDAITRIFQPIAPVWEIVEAVRHTVPVYLFSNTSEIHETFLLRTFPEFSRFHGGFFSWRLGCMKPEPGMYQRALTELGLPPHSIAYIDDLPANIEAGHRLGFHTHLYDRGNHDALRAFLSNRGLHRS